MKLDISEIRNLRIYTRNLAVKKRVVDPVKVVEMTCGINARLESAMMLSLRASIPGLPMEDIFESVSRGYPVKTWGVRGTLHLLASRDSGWMISLLGPVFSAKNRPRRIELGLDDRRLSEAMTKIGKKFRVIRVNRRRS